MDSSLSSSFPSEVKDESSFSSQEQMDSQSIQQQEKEKDRLEKEEKEQIEESNPAQLEPIPLPSHQIAFDQQPEIETETKKEQSSPSPSLSSPSPLQSPLQSPLPLQSPSPSPSQSPPPPSSSSSSSPSSPPQLKQEEDIRELVRKKGAKGFMESFNQQEFQRMERERGERERERGERERGRGEVGTVPGVRVRNVGQGREERGGEEKGIERGREERGIERESRREVELGVEVGSWQRDSGVKERALRAPKGQGVFVHSKKFWPLIVGVSFSCVVSFLGMLNSFLIVVFAFGVSGLLSLIDEFVVGPNGGFFSSFSEKRGGERGRGGRGGRGGGRGVGGGGGVRREKRRSGGGKVNRFGGWNGAIPFIIIVVCVGCVLLLIFRHQFSVFAQNVREGMQGERDGEERGGRERGIELLFLINLGQSVGMIAIWGVLSYAHSSSSSLLPPFVYVVFEKILFCCFPVAAISTFSYSLCTSLFSPSLLPYFFSFLLILSHSRFSVPTETSFSSYYHFLFPEKSTIILSPPLLLLQSCLLLLLPLLSHFFLFHGSIFSASSFVHCLLLICLPFLYCPFVGDLGAWDCFSKNRFLVSNFCRISFCASATLSLLSLLFLSLFYPSSPLSSFFTIYPPPVSFFFLSLSLLSFSFPPLLSATSTSFSSGSPNLTSKLSLILWLLSAFFFSIASGHSLFFFIPSLFALYGLWTLFYNPSLLGFVSFVFSCLVFILRFAYENMSNIGLADPDRSFSLPSLPLLSFFHSSSSSSVSVSAPFFSPFPVLSSSSQLMGLLTTVIIVAFLLFALLVLQPSSSSSSSSQNMYISLCVSVLYLLFSVMLCFAEISLCFVPTLNYPSFLLLLTSFISISLSLSLFSSKKTSAFCSWVPISFHLTKLSLLISPSSLPPFSLLFLLLLLSAPYFFVSLSSSPSPYPSYLFPFLSFSLLLTFLSVLSLGSSLLFLLEISSGFWSFSILLTFTIWSITSLLVLRHVCPRLLFFFRFFMIIFVPSVMGLVVWFCYHFFPFKFVYYLLIFFLIVLWVIGIVGFKASSSSSTSSSSSFFVSQGLTILNFLFTFFLGSLLALLTVQTALPLPPSLFYTWQYFRILSVFSLLYCLSLSIPIFLHLSPYRVATNGLTISVPSLLGLFPFGWELIGGDLEHLAWGNQSIVATGRLTFCCLYAFLLFLLAVYFKIVLEDGTVSSSSQIMGGGSGGGDGRHNRGERTRLSSQTQKAHVWRQTQMVGESFESPQRLNWLTTAQNTYVGLCYCVCCGINVWLLNGTEICFFVLSPLFLLLSSDDIPLLRYLGEQNRYAPVVSSISLSLFVYGMIQLHLISQPALSSFTPYSSFLSSLFRIALLTIPLATHILFVSYLWARHRQKSYLWVGFCPLNILVVLLADISAIWWLGCVGLIEGLAYLFWVFVARDRWNKQL